MENKNDTTEVNGARKPLLQTWAEHKLTQYLEVDAKGLSKNTAIFLSFIIGVLATIPIVYFDYYLAEIYPESFSENTLQFIIKWMVNIFIMLLFSAIEIYILYLITFRLFINLYRKYEPSDLTLFDYSVSYSFQSVMAQTALEFDDGPIELLKIDLDRNKNIRKATKLAYKSKIILSNMIAKALLRKFIFKNSLRGGVNYIAAPITGLWDAIVLYSITNKMEFILSSTDITNNFFDKKNIKLLRMSDNFFEACIRMTSIAICQTGDYHPNYKYLLIKLINEEYFNADLNSIHQIESTIILEEKIQKLDEREEINLLKFIMLIENISSKKKFNLAHYKEMLQK